MNFRISAAIAGREQFLALSRPDQHGRIHLIWTTGRERALKFACPEDCRIFYEQIVAATQRVIVPIDTRITEAA